MSREARVWREGELRWVEASGVLMTWQSASAVPTGTGTAAWASRSGLIGFVRAGLASEEAWNYATIAERGTPHHHKLVATNPVEVRFEVLFGVTADYPSANTAVGPSGRGVSRPQFNLELKMRDEEVATATGIYFQWNKAIMLSQGFGEAEEGDTFGFTMRALDLNGPTASGYLG